jgi:ribonuclease D
LTGSLPLPVEMVYQSAQLAAASRELAGSPSIALDTESNSLHHYPEQFCLIQIASSNKVYLIDVIALSDIEPLRGILEDASIEKVIHSADYDVRCLDRYSGLHICNLYDPGVAARFTGIVQFGLAALTKDLLGITITKSKRLQTGDWGRRPLSAEAIDYAASDVRYLVALREILLQRLRKLGRETWVAEECDRIEEIRYIAPNLETAYLLVKGARELDGRGLAVLKSLYLFREGEAQRWHRPPFFVIPDGALIFLATNPQADLSQVPGLDPIWLKRFGQGLRQAIHEGLIAPPVLRLPRIEFVRPTEAQVRRLSRLKEWRQSLGSSLSLDPSLLWPMASLERLAREPGSLNTEMALEIIRNWQREVVAPSLRACLKSLR